MHRWRIVVVLAMAACASKKEERAAGRARPDSAKVAGPVAVAEPAASAPAPEAVESAPRGALPAECQRYRTMVSGLGSCPALPSLAHDDAMRSYLALEKVWSTASPEALAALAGTCQQAADALTLTAAACPTIAGVPPLPSGGSRTAAAERGEPLDQAALGNLPHPFGALVFLGARSSRDEILAALPNARRDGEDKILVPVGVEDLMAEIAIDYTGHLDVVKIALPATAHERLVAAWGPPTPSGAWFDRTRRWRADLEDGVLMIGSFVPLAELVGHGPDGLAEREAVIGATPAELTQRFGARIAEPDVTDDEGDATGAKGYRLLLPATDVCKYYTLLQLDVVDGRVARATLTQCFDDDAGRRAVLAALESTWGRVTPARGADDRPVFTFNLPRRRVEARLAEPTEGLHAWKLLITTGRDQKR